MRSWSAITVGARVAEERIVAGATPNAPGPLPTGTVTFLFTDIEGSTRLLEEAGEAYATLLEDHRRLLRNAFRICGGHEVDTQGDSFFVAFASARAAV